MTDESVLCFEAIAACSTDRSLDYANGMIPLHEILAGTDAHCMIETIFAAATSSLLILVTWVVPLVIVEYCSPADMLFSEVGTSNMHIAWS